MSRLRSLWRSRSTRAKETLLAVAAPVGAGGAVGPRKPQTSARPGMLKLGIVEPGEGRRTVDHRP